MDSSPLDGIADVLVASYAGHWQNGKDNRRKVRHSCLFHDDPKPSADFYPDNGWYYCQAERQTFRLDEVLAELDMASDVTIAETDYEIRDEHGKLRAIHHRRDFIKNGVQDKSMPWRHPDGRLSKGGEIKPETLPLYGVELVSKHPSALVVLVEGEKARDALYKASEPDDTVAVATVTGSGATPSRESFEPLRGRMVALWPDNDDGGRKHMVGNGRVLAEMGCTLTWWTWRNAPPKGDAANLLPLYEGDAFAEIDEEPWPPDRIVQTDAQAEVTDGLVTIKASEIEPEGIEWLWDQVLVSGAFNLLAGIEGAGKSWFGHYITAATTRGWALPGELETDEKGRRYTEYQGGIQTKPSGRVLILSSEDSPSKAIVPRLIAVKADLALVDIVQGVGADKKFFSLLDDVAKLESQLISGGYTLVIVDPIDAYMGDEKRVNTHKNAPVRSVLGPIAEVMERQNVCLLGIHHFNKGGDKVIALHRVMGSVAYTASARSVVLFGKDPDEEKPFTRHAVVAKHNYAQRPPASMEFRLADGQFKFVGNNGMTAETLVSLPGKEDRSAKDEAVEWLKTQLSQGPIESKHLKMKAQHDGIGWRTVERAKKDIRIKTGKQGLVAGWFWEWLDAPVSIDSRAHN